MLREDKKIVIKAISDLGHRVTAADVASKTGLSLSDSTSQLNTIASEVGGHLEVSQKGDIAYRFKNGFQSEYLATGIRAFAAMIVGKISAFAFYLLKISFGLFLCLSLIIVVTSFIIFAVLSAAFGSEKDDLNITELVQFFNLLIFRDLIFGAAATVKPPRPEPQNEVEASLEGARPLRTRGNFFVNCFAFLFGAGNPNANLAEYKWQLAAQTIRENAGVVIKEQLAPYIGPALDDADSILPVLARFDGRPVVTATGNIAYKFPSLQVTGGTDQEEAQQDPASAAARQGYLVEERWRFTGLPADELKAVCAIAGLNLFGTIWLWFIFNQLFHFDWVWTEVMVIYGAFFFILPLIRYLFQTILNHRIRYRNHKRLLSAKNVSEPNQEMKEKLLEREKLTPSVTIRAIEPHKLAYTTERDNLEQKFEEEVMKGQSNLPIEKDERTRKDGQ